jgi:uncharacterized protein YcbK (DUF882 family)
MVTRDEVLKGRDRDYPLDAELEQNLSQLLDAVNKLRKVYGKPFIITSGYRPGHYNKSARGAKKSAHMSCQAVDIRDTDGEIAKWCLNNLKLLEEAGLYMESPMYTQTPAARWLHLQTRPTKNRVFIP